MKRLKRKFSKENSPAKSRRITNDDIITHREEAIARGRKFKYPVQYARHKLVINTIIISLVVLALLVAFAWWQLYYAQNTGQFLYRLTQIVPAPVASVEGQQVRYSDYLLRYRGSVHCLKNHKCPQNKYTSDFKDSNSNRQVRYIKRQILNTVEESAYATKVAKKYNISVSNSEVANAITKQRQSEDPPLSQSAEETVLSSFYGWSLDEYKEVMRAELLLHKVSFAVDTKALNRAKLVSKKLTAKNAKFAKIAARYSDDASAKTNGGDVGFVDKHFPDADGLLSAALKLKKGQVSSIIKGVDGYYIIKLLDSNKSQVHYVRIKISLTQFNSDFAKAQSSQNTKEYIKIPKYN